MRKPYQDVLVELLQEVDVAARECNIPYVCINRLAWDAYKFHAFHDTTYDAYIAVSSEDIEQLKSYLLANNASRDFDSYEEGGVSMLRYISTSSLYIDLEDTRNLSKPALGIDIYILNFSCENCCEYHFDSDTLKFNRDVFFPAHYQAFEGLNLPIPGKFDTFFSKIVSKDWREKNYCGKIRRNKLEVISSADVPFDLVMQLPYAKNAFNLQYFKNRRYYNELIAKENTLSKKIKTYDDKRRLTARRFYHWEQLYPRKAEIISLSKENRIEEIEEILGSYLSEVRSFAKNGLGLYIDYDIFEISKPILINRHGESFFKKYEKSIHKKHRIDIDEYLRKNGIDHPLLN